MSAMGQKQTLRSLSRTSAMCHERKSRHELLFEVTEALRARP